MESQQFVSATFIFLNVSMTERIERVICHARSHILISHTQTALSFKSNGTTPLDDFGTSPSPHCIHPHVDPAGVLSNCHAPAGLNGILWIYHLYC